MTTHHITSRQHELLRAIAREPRAHHLLCDEYADALDGLERELAELENAGFIELALGRRWRVTGSGADLLAAQPCVAPPRNYGNATMREPLRAKPWVSVREGADNHKQCRSLTLDEASQ